TVSGATTIHYDGDDILFLTDNSGSLTDVRLETLGDFLPKQNVFLVMDRNFNGTLTNKHDNLAYDPVNLASTSWHTAGGSSADPLNGGSPAAPSRHSQAI